MNLVLFLHHNFNNFSLTVCTLHSFTPASSPLSNRSPSPQPPEQEIKPKTETIENTTPKIESIENATLENVFIVPDIVLV